MRFRFHPLIRAASLRDYNDFSPEGVRRNRGLVREGLVKIREHCRENGTRFFAILYPHLGEEEAAWEKAAHLQAISLFEELEVPYIQVREDFREYGVESLRKRPDDNVHPNLEGHGMAARKFLAVFGGDIGLAGTSRRE